MSQDTKDKLIFLVSGLLIGLGAMAFFYNFKTIHWAQAELKPAFSQNRPDFSKLSDQVQQSFFTDDFFDEDPFLEMKELRKRMWNRFGDSTLFSNRKSFFGAQDLDLNSLGSFHIKKIEATDHVIYEISMANAAEGSSIDVTVENQIVHVRGQRVERREDSRDQMSQNFYSSSSLAQSFSLPEGLDTENVTIENQGQKIVLRFPKLNSEV